MKTSLIDKVINWSAKADPKKVKRWEKYCREYLKKWKWNKKAINDFIEWGNGGFNNKVFHFDTTVEDFYSEVNYASDRMSLDRLVRCHVKYRTLYKEPFFE